MQKEKLSVICTTFPQYDWVRQIIGTEKMGGIDLTLLLDSGIDLHSFQPSAEVAVNMGLTFIRQITIYIHNCAIFLGCGHTRTEHHAYQNEFAQIFQYPPRYYSIWIFYGAS
jgi:hypothetical protein